MFQKVCCVTALIVAACLGGTAQASLLAYYQFEGNANDDSGYGNNGTLKNHAAIVTDPARGQVLSLDGADDVCKKLIPSSARNCACPSLGLDWSSDRASRNRSRMGCAVR